MHQSRAILNAAAPGLKSAAFGYGVDEGWSRAKGGGALEITREQPTSHNSKDKYHGGSRDCPESEDH